MPVYEFKCKTCGERWSQYNPMFGMICENGDDHEVVRDWKAEGAALLRENIRAVPRG